MFHGLEPSSAVAEYPVITTERIGNNGITDQQIKPMALNWQRISDINSPYHPVMKGIWIPTALHPSSGASFESATGDIYPSFII